MNNFTQQSTQRCKRRACKKVLNFGYKMGEIENSSNNVRGSWLSVFILGSSVLVTSWREMGIPGYYGRNRVCRLQGPVFVPPGHRSRHIGISIGFRKVRIVRYLCIFKFPPRLFHHPLTNWLNIILIMRFTLFNSSKSSAISSFFQSICYLSFFCLWRGI